MPGPRRRAAGLLLAAVLAGPAAAHGQTLNCPAGAGVVMSSDVRSRTQSCRKMSADGREIMHGPYVQRDLQRGTKVEGEYREGQQFGRWTTWYANGRKDLEALYRDGMPEGRATGWHDNGRKAAEGDFVAGAPHGPFIFFDSWGRRRLVLDFKDGVLAGSKAWDEGGREVEADDDRVASIVERSGAIQHLILLGVTAGR
jgi:hypothetical protein